MATAAGIALPAAALPPGLRRHKILHRRPPRFLMSVDNRSFGSLNVRSKEHPEQSAAADGVPRWFSPLECGKRSTGSPLLLYLPGIDGDGFGLVLHHRKLGQIFDIWCFHVPFENRAPLADLVGMVESVVRAEHKRDAGRPIYIVGECFGASLALAIAAGNPDIDLVLILANPAISLRKSLLQSVAPLLNMALKHLQDGLLDARSIPVETIPWKLRLIHEIDNFLDSHLHAVKAQTLILTSGKDMVLSRITEGERLRRSLQCCEIRSFIGNGDPLLLDNTFDLVATIKGACYYRRGNSIDYVLDYLPPTRAEYMAAYEPYRWLYAALSPVMFSTTDMGKVVRGLGGIPSDGPVLFVGNHMMLGMDIVPIFSKFWFDRKIITRMMAHPAFFKRLKQGKLPDVSLFDSFRIFGIVPVSAANMYKLLSLKSYVVLFPGGVREALHQKGEECKLMWPVEPEFVRMAARFGATIVPFGSVGEDDIVELMLDSDDQMKIPPLKSFIEELTSEAVTLRNNAKGEVGNQLLYYPVCLPKLPGRLYFLFGKPISTQGKKEMLHDQTKSQEMYEEIQKEIQRCINYLKEKRESDPFRNLLSRLAYQSYHGFDVDIPSFET